MKSLLEIPNFDLENKNGSMFLEPRTDKGVGIFVHVDPVAKSVCLALTKEEAIMMTRWLVDYVSKIL